MQSAEILNAALLQGSVQVNISYKPKLAVIFEGIERARPIRDFSKVTLIIPHKK